MPAAKSQPDPVVIFVHGIQGSWLKNEYPVDYDDKLLWSGITRRKMSALHLHPRDASVDQDAETLVEPHQMIPLIYKEIVEEIRDELSERPYVYAFRYDWRKDNREAAKALRNFTARALQIAAVHEQSAGHPAPKRVVYIGHSMGGLVIKWLATKLLRTTRDRRFIDKIITIATPYGGSLKSVEALLPGARNLFGVEHRKSMRHAARTFPGVFQLLPAWQGALVQKKDGQPLDVFSAKSWQANLVESLEKGPFFKGYLEQRLADAADFAQASYAPWPASLRKRVYCAIGQGSETWSQVTVDTDKGNFFAFDSAATDEDGDGTVHLQSSARPELASSHIYTDTKRGLADRAIGQHANMPNHGQLQDWVLGLLRLNEYSDRAFDSPA